MVERTSRCWRCHAENCRLVHDPLIASPRDSIGVCQGCANARRDFVARWGRLSAEAEKGRCDCGHVSYSHRSGRCGRCGCAVYRKKATAA